MYSFLLTHGSSKWKAKRLNQARIREAQAGFKKAQKKRTGLEWAEKEKKRRLRLYIVINNSPVNIFQHYQIPSISLKNTIIHTEMMDDW